MDRVVRLVSVVCLLLSVLDGVLSKDGERELDGPRDVRAYVGSMGGGVRFYREVPGGDKPRKTGQIEIRIGRIREVGNGTDEANKTAGGPRRKNPGVDDIKDLDFDVSENKYGIVCRSRGRSQIFGFRARFGLLKD